MYDMYIPSVQVQLKNVMKTPPFPERRHTAQSGEDCRMSSNWQKNEMDAYEEKDMQRNLWPDCCSQLLLTLEMYEITTDVNTQFD